MFAGNLLLGHPELIFCVICRKHLNYPMQKKFGWHDVFCQIYFSNAKHLHKHYIGIECNPGLQNLAKYICSVLGGK